MGGYNCDWVLHFDVNTLFFFLFQELIVHDLSDSNDSSDEKMMITFGEDGDSN